jgi:hypothetical protein
MFNCAGVAQLVELLICNQPVAGSSPVTSFETLSTCDNLYYLRQSNQKSQLQTYSFLLALLTSNRNTITLPFFVFF